MIRSKKMRRLLLCLAVVLALVGYVVWGNTSIQVTEISVTAAGLPEEFSGYRIAQVSDLHNTEFGEDNQGLLRLLAESRPDIIVLTGDLIDSRRTNVDIALTFAKAAAEIAPTYYITGNHEARVPAEYERLRAGLIESGVRVLEDEAVTLARDGASVTLLGIHDPNFGPIEENLMALSDGLEGYAILLAHHPELVEYYAQAGMDLVFSGHAHGGQFRFPLIGGLIAPGQGLLPAYDAGLYTVDNTHMIVSRGLGNSIFPFRLNNRPELILAELNPVP